MAAAGEKSVIGAGKAAADAKPATGAGKAVVEGKPATAAVDGNAAQQAHLPAPAGTTSSGAARLLGPGFVTVATPGMDLLETPAQKPLKLDARTPRNRFDKLREDDDDDGEAPAVEGGVVDE